MNYYNEHDRYAAAWLRELIADGQIPKGEVDERNIVDVQPADLAGFTQCHWFAGLGGWPYALRLASWPNERPVWTGSCPCQPFSSAGKQKGLADERHLWPAWFRLIRKCKPPVVFGEQVEAAVRHGWLDGVFADMEGEGYACGAAVLGAHSVGAPHIRQRLYWVADASESTGQWNAGGVSRTQASFNSQDRSEHGDCAVRFGDGGAVGRLANADQSCCDGRTRSGKQSLCDEDREDGGMANSQTTKWGRKNEADESGWWITEVGGSSVVGGMGDAISNGTEWTGGAECQFVPAGQANRMGQPNSAGLFEGQPPSETARYRSTVESAGCACRLDLSASEQMGRTGQPRQEGAWDDFDLIPCADGKIRRVESGTFPLVTRLSETVVPSGDPSLSYVQATAEGRQMRLRGYGNAIVPQVAAEFIVAYMMNGKQGAEQGSCRCERRKGAG